MRSWILLCLCVAYVSAQVIVPPLSPENQRATDEHLAAVAKATQTHFAAHKNIAPESGGAYAPQQYAPQHNALPYGQPAGLGYSGASYSPYGFGYNYGH